MDGSAEFSINRPIEGTGTRREVMIEGLCDSAGSGADCCKELVANDPDIDGTGGGTSSLSLSRLVNMRMNPPLFLCFSDFPPPVGVSGAGSESLLSIFGFGLAFMVPSMFFAFARTPALMERDRWRAYGEVSISNEPSPSE